MPDHEPVAFSPRNDFPSLLAVFRAARENTLEMWTTPTYRERYLCVPLVLWRKAHFVSEPDLIRAILSDPTRFPKAPMQHYYLRPALGRGILTSDGPDWRRQRRITQPEFQGKRLNALVPRMTGAIEAHLQRWERMPAGTRFDLREEMMHLTLDILCDTIFQFIEFDRDGLGDAITEYLDVFIRPDVWDMLRPPFWLPLAKNLRVRPSVRKMHTQVKHILDQRRADPDPPDDLLSLMLAARSRTGDEFLSESELSNNLLTFLAAGHETTASALTWTFYLLSEFPWAAERLKAEADAVLGDRLPGPEDLPRLTFAQQVLQESMRLYAPVPLVDRTAAKTIEVEGKRFGKNDAILISPFVLHRHETLWDRPNHFDPDRFTPAAVRERHRYQYLPFIAGPRSCIGAQFALIEGVLALSALGRAFRFVRDPDHEIYPEAFVTLRPRGGLPGYWQPW